MKIKIKYFGMIAESTGKDSESFDIEEGTSVGGLQDRLYSDYPELKEMNFKIAVDQELAAPEFIIGENAEIAILPPFAGG